MAALMTVGTVAAFFAPEPESDLTATHPPLNFIATVVAPIKELIARLAPMALVTLVLVAGFRMPGYISNAMAVPLFKSLHYSDTDIATVTKLFGFWVGLGGTFLASFVMPRLGMMASLLLGTVAGSASHLALAWLAAHGDHGGLDFWTFAIAVSIDSFAYAFASIVLITYMSSLTATRGEPVCAPDIDLRVAGQPDRRDVGLFRPLAGLRAVFHRDVPHRRAGRGPVLVGLACAGENDRSLDRAPGSRRRIG
jgi:PAT family beta-lactamase induction signal transducer AmpG